MIAFSGATQDLKHALFLLTDDVSSVAGDGRCVPGPDNCRLLRLKVGDEAKLAYGPEGDRTYKLKLFGIALAPADAHAASKQGKRGSPSGAAWSSRSARKNCKPSCEFVRMKAACAKSTSAIAGS